uniref:Triacylglycerol lipase n=1 Tax=Leptobrachium leishanense TaxID=445787 RepID=A0A8C5MCF2_9ANUR
MRKSYRLTPGTCSTGTCSQRWQLALTLLCLPLDIVGLLHGQSLCMADGMCYPTNPPYGATPERPIAVLPMMAPVRFLLLSKSNKTKYQEISLTDPSTISKSDFNPKADTRVIIHGYTESGQEQWMLEMCQAFMQAGHCNCFVTDWGSASMTIYAQAANTIFSAGNQLSTLLRILQSMGSSHFHLVGHSLGSHIAAQAARIFHYVDRITGLDPAGIYFENTPYSVRLDKRHAKFVDVIHCNAVPFSQLGLGIIQPIGHFDFYPNKGKHMPECDSNRSTNHLEVLCTLSPLLGPINCSQDQLPCPEHTKDVKFTLESLTEYKKKIFCDHYQAIRYFTESITDMKKFQSFPCESVEKALAGECATDGPSEGFPTMGYHSIKSKSVTTSSQVFVLKT